MSDHAADRALRPARHEPQDVSLRFMVRLLALIGGVLLTLLGVARWVFPSTVQDQRFAQPFPDFPAPKLQPNTPADMRAFYADEMARLNGVGWQDRASGTVRIPIDQAMHDLARDGIPGWPTGQRP